MYRFGVWFCIVEKEVSVNVSAAAPVYKGTNMTKLGTVHINSNLTIFVNE